MEVILPVMQYNLKVTFWGKLCYLFSIQWDTREDYKKSCDGLDGMSEDS